MWNSKTYKKILSNTRAFFNRTKGLLVGILLVPIVLTLLLVGYSAAYVGRVYPNIYVAGVSVGGLTQDEAQTILTRSTTNPKSVTFTSANQSFELDLSTVGFSYDIEKSVSGAFGIGRTGNYLYDIGKRFSALYTRTDIGLRLNIDENQVNEFLSVVAGAVSVDPVYPKVELQEGNLVIERGRAGTKLDKSATRIALGQTLSRKGGNNIALPVESIDPTITEAEAGQYLARAEQLVTKSLVLNSDEVVFGISGNNLLALLDPKGGYNLAEINASVNDLLPQVNREAQNSVFVYEGGKVREFMPSHEGVAVEVGQLTSFIVDSLEKLEQTNLAEVKIEIPTTKTQPAIKTEDVNALGIRELIGRGTSRFAGSIASRVHNIGVASSRFNGTLVAPGDILSFNQVLGDVSEYTGYKQAYVIRDGQTVLGDGGGVCQVSTTLFRAALDAGLPITERRAHSYRVGYYEQDALPGLDATVYAPTTDLKIENNTPGHILIQTEFVPNTATLIFDIYGTDDGRVATTTKPVVYDYIAPPADLYIDDPSKPAGYIEQIDWKAPGSKSRFDYKVEKDGEVVYEKTFFSNYKAWQSKFIRGTGPSI